MRCPEGLGDAGSSEQRQEANADGGVDEGDRRYIVSKCASVNPVDRVPPSIVLESTI
jgi:hypothetical protein